jgi:CTP:molybdopterin cytidylyltransferase MocA
MTASESRSLCGVVLAAGAGTRYGGPKALARTPTGEPWVSRAVSMLVDGGCDLTLVTLGAAREEAAALVPAATLIVNVRAWRVGISESVRAALAAAASTSATAVVLVAVDTPDMPPSVVRRVVEVAGTEPTALGRAVYAGAPGHPVIIGREHWESVSASLVGDRGAARYLRAHDASLIECGDLWDGADIDRR